MKTVAMATIALMMLAGIALADQSSCALTEVEVKIVSNVSVGGSDHVNLGEYQQGDIPADLTFQVESNCEAVKLCVFATDLYKGNPDDPNNPYSIPVDVDQPVIIDAPGTNPRDWAVAKGRLTTEAQRGKGRGTAEGAEEARRGAED